MSPVAHLADEVARHLLCPTLMRESRPSSTNRRRTSSRAFFLKHANAQWVEDLKKPAQQEAMRKSTSAQRSRWRWRSRIRNLRRRSIARDDRDGTDTGPVGRFQGFFELKSWS